MSGRPTRFDGMRSKKTAPVTGDRPRKTEDDSSNLTIKNLFGLATQVKEPRQTGIQVEESKWRPSKQISSICGRFRHEPGLYKWRKPPARSFGGLQCTPRGCDSHATYQLYRCMDKPHAAFLFFLKAKPCILRLMVSVISLQKIFCICALQNTFNVPSDCISCDGVPYDLTCCFCVK